jgi:hypothetical protein
MSAAQVTQLNPKGQDQGNQVAEVPELTLLRRLLAVEQDLPVIAKSGYNPEQKYHFIEGSAIAATMQDLFARHGVYLKTELTQVNFSEFQSKSGARGEKATVYFVFTFINCFDKDDYMKFEPWPGVAMDYSDKALGKAMTAAQKTFLMKQFLISDVDPDADSPEAAANHHQQAAARPAQQTQQNRPQAQTQQPAPAAQQPAPKVPNQRNQPNKHPSPSRNNLARMADLTKDEFAGYLKEMGITSAKIAETLSGGKQTTLKDWSEAYKAANPEANIKNWYRFALHEYTAWLVKNNPAAGWLWDNKNQVPQQLEDVPFEETPGGPLAMSQQLEMFGSEIFHPQPTASLSGNSSLPGSVKLRPYQEEALAKIEDYRQQGYNRQLLHLATGLGKTISAAESMRRANQPVLAMMHREELAYQAMAAIRTVWPGASVGLVKAENNQTGRDVTVALVQTLSSEKRFREAFPVHRLVNPHFIWTDEVHHGASATYKWVYGQLGYLKRAGKTSTWG